MDPILCQDEEYREALRQLDELMQEMEAIPFPQIKDLFLTILQYFDVLHREPLSRFHHILEQQNPELAKQLSEDFTFTALLNLYDLKLKAAQPSPAEPAAVNFIAADQVKILTPVVKAEKFSVGQAGDFTPNQPYAKIVEGNAVVVATVANEWYALENACVDSILPLHLGRIEDHYLICPWHGCRYDLSTGAMENKPQVKVRSFPIELNDEGQVVVEVTIPVTNP